MSLSHPLVLDYLYIEPGPSSPDPVPPTISSVLVTAANNPPTASSMASSSSKHAGAIAGGVLSGVIFMLLIILLVILLKRRLRTMHSRRQIPTSVTGATSPELPENRPQSIPMARNSQPQKPDWKGRFYKSKSSNLSDAYGYNRATIEQTRAMKKGREVQETRA